MKVSVTISGLARLFGDDLAAVLSVAQVADEVGINQLVIPDHLAIGDRTDRYPFGTFPYPPEEPWLEPLATLSAFAAVTKKIRLGTGILITPLRGALVTAKTVATLDVLSKGRLDLGLGTGWQREEFIDPGAPFADRAERADDIIRACRALWSTPPPVSFSSPSFSFKNLWCEPRPTQVGGIPLWFGGGATLSTASRIAELGNGWLPIGAMSDDDLKRGIELIRGSFATVGRDPATLCVRAGLPAVTDKNGDFDLEATLVPVPALAAEGVTTVSIALGRFLKNRDAINPFLSELGAAFS